MTDEMALLVSGQVILEGAQSFSSATVRVRLEDVTQLDVPSVTVAEQVIARVSYQVGSQQGVPFCLVGRAPDLQARYGVRVHVDVDGDGFISVGDWLSTQSHPVLTDGHPDRVTVQISQVV